ncbi:methyltransferase domain-containing protein [Candidatus Bathyarchaeota archaeon]|nr:methyltransferase domain-containing protein [Candidatus Bathyarchaeota archaeon]
MVEQQKNYAWNAGDYAKHSSSQYEWAKELIPKLKLSGNEALLDIVCGDGKVTAALAKSLPRGCIVGIDNSEDMVTLAHRTFLQDAYPNLSFQRMDARALTFQEKFDRVFSNAALHWIIDQQSVLHGVQRSLKSGGRLLFQMGGKGNAQDIMSSLNPLLREDPWKKFFSDFSFPYGFYAPEEYRAWLLEAKLKPERAELLRKDMKLSGKAGLAGWIRTTWLPYTERLPTKLRNTFIEEIVDTYLEKHPLDAAGTAHVGMVRLEVEASKPASTG